MQYGRVRQPRPEYREGAGKEKADVFRVNTPSQWLQPGLRIFVDWREAFRSGNLASVARLEY
jgi:hypothetical protein